MNKDANDLETEVIVVHCWSAPRSRSTALLYSFESRHDCVAIDEPLYRRWLMNKANDKCVFRPYSEELIAGKPPDISPEGKEWDENKWSREKYSLAKRIKLAIETLGKGGGVVFVKHMAKHSFLYDFGKDCEACEDNLEIIEGVKVRNRHLLLIRDPVAILSSWGVVSAVHDSATPDEVGIVQLLSIYSSLNSKRNGDPSIPVTILDSDDLVSDSSLTLQAVCHDLGIPYTDSMLTWNSGPHECDGPWSYWWYKNVHNSSGWFAQNNERGNNSSYRTINPSLMPALRISLPAYTYLKSLTHGHQGRGPPPQSIYEDARNINLLVWVGAPGRGRILPREMAGLSPWDSSVQGGDATWEGIRIYRGKIFKLERHLQRLLKSAKALGFESVHTKEEIVEAIFKTLAANGMRDGAHIRLTLTRGEKCTSSMNPKFNVYGTTLIVLAEFKPTEGATTYDNSKGISLITSSTRRNSPSTCDSKIHHNNMINNILPKIQANLSGAADAIMLDLDGFVSETNATNLFMVDEGVLMTPHADHCLPGITRETLLILAKESDIPTVIRRITLAEFHSADEVFTTGTMGELTPVTMIDGRTIGTGSIGPVTVILQKVYSKAIDRQGWSTNIPDFVPVSTQTRVE